MASLEFVIANEPLANHSFVKYAQPPREGLSTKRSAEFSPIPHGPAERIAPKI